jgi:hypothetical protein
MQQKSLSSWMVVPLLLISAIATAAPARKAPVPRKSGERYYLNIVAVEYEDGVKAQALEKLVRDKFAAQIAARAPEFMTTLDGAPDPKTAPDAFATWATRKKIRAFDVRIKFVKYSRTLAPIAGSNDQMLSVNVEVQLLGANVPMETLGMTGTGTGTVSAQVGKTVTAKVEDDVHAQAIDGALANAFDEATKQLRAFKPTQAPKAPAKPKRAAKTN